MMPLRIELFKCLMQKGCYLQRKVVFFCKTWLYASTNLAQKYLLNFVNLFSLSPRPNIAILTVSLFALCRLTLIKRLQSGIHATYEGGPRCSSALTQTNRSPKPLSDGPFLSPCVYRYGSV